MVISKKYWKLFVFGFGIFTFSILTFLALNFLSTHCYEWCIGDWLINYQGGIVRRGLPGEIFFNLSQIFGINQIILTVSFQVILYGIFIFNSCRLAMHSSFSTSIIILFVSPAFILFPILDPLGSFRKEILLFALLSFMCYSLLSPAKLSEFFPFFLGLCSAFIVLSHEILTVYLPYLIIASLLYEKKLGKITKGVMIAIAPSAIIGFLISVLAHGNEQIVFNICNSLANNAPLDCTYPYSYSGAISFLDKDFSFAHEFVLISISEDIWILYILLAVLSFTPIFLILTFGKLNIMPNKEVRFWTIVFLLIPIICSILLLWIVADYGRIIYINTVCISLLILMAASDKNNKPMLINLRSSIPLVLCLIFPVSWRLIHWKASIENSFPLLSHIINSLH